MSNAELIEQADDLRGDESEVFYMMHKLKDALEVAERERHTRELHHFESEEALAAAQAQLRAVLTCLDSFSWHAHDKGFVEHTRRYALSPTDALQAHDRAVAEKAWGEGLQVAYNHVGRLEDADAAGQGVTIPDPVNPYRAALGVPVGTEKEGKN